MPFIPPVVSSSSVTDQCRVVHEVVWGVHFAAKEVCTIGDCYVATPDPGSIMDKRRVADEASVKLRKTQRHKATLRMLTFAMELLTCGWYT